MKTRLLLLSMISGFAIAVAPPASAWSHEFQRCIKIGAGGSFETSHCIAAGGANEFAWRAVPEGEKFALNAAAAVTAISSTNVRFKCTTTGFTGEAKASAGLVGEFQLKNCAFSEREASGQFGNPKACVVAATIKFEIKGEMVNGTTEPAFEFGAKGGKVFTSLKANEPGSGAGCKEYTFESLAEGKGEKCSVSESLAGAEVHAIGCSPCNTELLLGTEGAILLGSVAIELAAAKEWWRST